MISIISYPFTGDYLYNRRFFASKINIIYKKQSHTLVLGHEMTGCQFFCLTFNGGIAYIWLGGKATLIGCTII